MQRLKLFIATWLELTDLTNPSAGYLILITEKGTWLFPFYNPVSYFHQVRTDQSDCGLI
jgi:hypothetical protein